MLGAINLNINTSGLLNRQQVPLFRSWLHHPPDQLDDTILLVLSHISESNLVC